MLQVLYIVNRLTDKQAKSIALVLEENHGYADVSLELFNAYYKQDQIKIEEIKSSLDHHTFKIFERIIYRTCLEYFELKDTHYQELILTSMFYLLHGSGETDRIRREEKLANLFNQLKFYGIEEVSSPLLEQLVDLNQNTPLKTVYKHLLNRYKKANQTTYQLIDLLEQLNGSFNETKSKELIRRQIKTYKQIRRLANQDASPINKSIFQISLLSMCIEAGQRQLINSQNETVEELLKSCQHSIKKLPFGFIKFFLKNILTYLKIRELTLQGEKRLALKELQSIKHKIIDAYNFNLNSSHFNTLERTILQPKSKKKQNYLTLIKNPLEGIHYENPNVSGNRLSYS
jgi:hypothetical protein